MVIVVVVVLIAGEDIRELLTGKVNCCGTNPLTNKADPLSRGKTDSVYRERRTLDGNFMFVF